MAAPRRAAGTAALLGLLLSGPAGAVRPIIAQAPDIPADRTWLNAKPLPLQALRGRRAVVVAFLNTANINSLRASKVLETWWRHYALKGLMIVAVHPPLYGFQKSPGDVRASLRQWGLTFPVVLDTDKSISKAWANEGWPAFYLADHRGRVIHDLLGENGYEEFEAELRAALDRVPGYAAPDEPPAAKDPKVKDCGAMTPETTLRAGRVEVVDLDRTELAKSLVLVSAREGEVSTRGTWSADPDGLRLEEGNSDHSSFVRVIYRGTQGFAVASAPSESKFFVRQDDLWLHLGNAGKDVQFDDDGRSFVVVGGAPRLYRLAQNADDTPHELTLIPLRKGSMVYGFSFSDQCLKL